MRCPTYNIDWCANAGSTFTQRQYSKLSRKYYSDANKGLLGREGREDFGAKRKSL